MTPISPTALEEAAKAMEPDAWDSKAPGADDRREDARIMATAAITAYLAQREKEGFVEVRVEPGLVTIITSAYSGRSLSAAVR